MILVKYLYEFLVEKGSDLILILLVVYFEMRHYKEYKLIMITLWFYNCVLKCLKLTRKQIIFLIVGSMRYNI
jgi:hypothetical protein